MWNKVNVIAVELYVGTVELSESLIHSSGDENKRPVRSVLDQRSQPGMLEWGNEEKCLTFSMRWTVILFSCWLGSLKHIAYTNTRAEEDWEQTNYLWRKRQNNLFILLEYNSDFHEKGPFSKKHSQLSVYVNVTKLIQGYSGWFLLVSLS